jgi:hypothetical protein
LTHQELIRAGAALNCSELACWRRADVRDQIKKGTLEGEKRFGILIGGWCQHFWVASNRRRDGSWRRCSERQKFAHRFRQNAQFGD